MSDQPNTCPTCKDLRERYGKLAGNDWFEREHQIHITEGNICNTAGCGEVKTGYMMGARVCKVGHMQRPYPPWSGNSTQADTGDKCPTCHGTGRAPVDTPEPQNPPKEVSGVEPHSDSSVPAFNKETANYTLEAENKINPIGIPEPKFACLCLPVHNSKAEHDAATPFHERTDQGELIAKATEASNQEQHELLHPTPDSDEVGLCPWCGTMKHLNHMGLCGRCYDPTADSTTDQ